MNEMPPSLPYVLLQDGEEVFRGKYSPPNRDTPDDRIIEDAIFEIEYIANVYPKVYKDFHIPEWNEFRIRLPDGEWKSKEK